MKRMLVIALGVSVGCAGTSYTISSAADVPSPVADAFACLRQQIQTVGYSQRSLDVVEHRVTAQRFDDTVQRPDVHFRRMVDVLEFQVGAGPSGGSSIKVESKTFAEYMSQQGRTFEQEATSESVRATGQAVLAACGH
jgi:hypothetical protein